MERLKKLYAELCENVFLKESKYKETRLSSFVAMRGKNYKEDNTVRFMVVGRAVNGWGESMSQESAEEYAEEAVKLFEDPNRFQTEWDMRLENDEPYSEYTVLDDDGNPVIQNGKAVKKRYYLSKSPFWSTTLGIYKKLSGSEKSDCYEDIVWNNIYKVAPLKEGNPSTNLIYAQAKTCVKILREEIRLLNPTHILLVIDKSWISWTSRNKVMFDFMKAFEGYECCCRALNDPEKSIVQCAFEADGRKVLVTCRPEGVARDKYINAVIDAFGKMK